MVDFTDSDWAGDPDDQNSTTCYVFSLGSGPVTWDCKKQQALALSSAEAEYRAAINASQDWLPMAYGKREVIVKGSLIGIRTESPGAKAICRSFKADMIWGYFQ